MTMINATNARKNLFTIIANTIKNSTPVTITSKEGNVVVISEDDWASIQETLYLNSIPGMAQSIIDGMNTPDDELIDMEDIDIDSI